MTVSTTSNKTAAQVMGAATYSFNFHVITRDPALDDAKRAIKCEVRNASGEHWTLTYGTDYSVTLNENGSGGTVTVTNVRDNTHSIVIYREYATTQESDYENYNTLPASTIENNFDKLTMMVQQINEKTGRAIFLPITADTDTIKLDFPEPIPKRALKWNATATNLENSEYDLDEVTDITVAAKDDAVSAKNEAEGYATTALNAKNSILNNAGFIAVSADLTGSNNIGTVATDLSGSDTIGTVATNISDVNAVGSNITAVTAVNANKTNINAVNSNKTNIDTVATNIADVGTVAGDIANVNSVAADLTNIDAVAGDLTNIDIVAAFDPSALDAVVGDIASINAVAADLTNIDAVNTNATNINAVNANKTNIDICADNISTIGQKAGLNEANIFTKNQKIVNAADSGLQITRTDLANSNVIPAVIAGFGGVTLYANNSEICGRFGGYLNETGITTSFMNARRRIGGENKNCMISVKVDSNGNIWTEAPTPAVNDNSTKIATTAYVQNKLKVVSALPSSPTSGVFYFVTA